MTFDDTWAEAVHRWCDPVFAAADCGFEWNDSAHYRGDDGQTTSLLWEADPERFAERYPDSGIIESYGEDHWPPPCIDYWIYVDPPAGSAELSVDGWAYWPEPIPLSGDGEADGRLLANRFAEILRVNPPADPGS
jgi:hypothetical protein